MIACLQTTQGLAPGPRRHPSNPPAALRRKVQLVKVVDARAEALYNCTAPPSYVAPMLSKNLYTWEGLLVLQAKPKSNKSRQTFSVPTLPFPVHVCQAEDPTFLPRSPDIAEVAGSEVLQAHSAAAQRRGVVGKGRPHDDNRTNVRTVEASAHCGAQQGHHCMSHSSHKHARTAHVPLHSAVKTPGQPSRRRPWPCRDSCDVLRQHQHSTSACTDKTACSTWQGTSANHWQLGCGVRGSLQTTLGVRSSFVQRTYHRRRQRL